jgi:hypothetical protein
VYCTKFDFWIRVFYSNTNTFQHTIVFPTVDPSDPRGPWFSKL